MIVTNIKMAYLELFVGPMFSGKTSKLLALYDQYRFCDIPVAVINHSADTRYHRSLLSTHDKKMIPCIQTSSLCSLINDTAVLTSDVILINEGQFFDDIVAFVRRMLVSKKKVYVAGLDGDFERKKFGHLLDLIPVCDKVTKLSSLCARCKDGTKAVFSLRLVANKSQMLIGSENYMPVCRSCYEKNASSGILDEANV
jgi:thymidine kinase